MKLRGTKSVDALERWLATVGLEQLAPLLRSQDVDLDVLAELSDADLEKIGVSLGLRRKLLKALDQRRLHQAAPSPPAVAEPCFAERRHLTVMFCDLVGSTAMSSRLDPEELGDILRTYRDAVAAQVVRFDGHVAQYLGDGVLAYFGWPRAHEHEAEQAVRAGLAAIEAITSLPSRQNIVLAARIGIATGLVVVGERAAHDETAIGETPNLAARLQALATPNTVVIEAATQRLLGALFEYEVLPAFEAKGIAQPVQAFKVLRQSTIESRFEALHPSALTPLVGRDEEVQLLLRRWGRAKAGIGQVVMISGEPGIGKSRVTAALIEHIGSERYMKLRYFCSPHHRDSALYPIANQIERAAALERDDEPSVKLDKLEALFTVGAACFEDRRLVAELLRLPETGRYPPLSLNPQQRKQRTFDILLRQLDALAAVEPLLCVFEDMHWIDPTSLEMLERMIERVRRLPVLVVLTFRPEFVPPWIGEANVTLMSLNRLDRRDGAALIERVVGNHRLPQEIVNEIVERTDGVPLFAEELTKAVLEAGNSEAAARTLASMPAHTVPATLYASLMARLDRLGSAREIAQIGAAIGRECPHDILAAVSAQSEADLRASIEKLTASGLLLARGAPPDAVYVFKHALVQDATYATLLMSKREQLHRRIAEVLETQFPDQAAREPELLARHFAEAKLPHRAIGYWIKAGRHAAERSANLEAITHLSRALDALKLQPESEARDRQELVAQTAIGTPLMSVHGYAAPQTGAAYARAHLLTQRLGDRAGLRATLSGQFSYHFVRGDPAMMRQLALDATTTAEATSDDALRLVGCRLAGLSAIHFGKFAEARTALETIVRSYDPSKHRPPPDHYVHDPKMYALGYLAVILWIQGYPDTARRWSAAAIDYTAELHHANMTAFARVYGGAGLHELLGDTDVVRRHVDAVIELADQHSLHYFRLSGLILQAWLIALAGDLSEGIRLMRLNIEERFSLGVSWYQVRYLCMLAELCHRQGDAGAGLDLLARAMRHIEDHEENMWRAEVQRLRAEMLRLGGMAARLEIESCLRESVAIARRQGAKSFELRAATSLASFWRELGRRDDARQELASVMGWFTEGFDTADLRRARELLTDLA
ncbi:MAG TPA: AAA family ATPase [Burkholderiaceae bacterium]